MQYFQEIALDVFETNTYQYIEAKEGDSASRFLKITVTRNREPIKVDEDTSVSFRAIKADGTSVLNPAMINSDGTITAELTDQTLACPGEVIADISLSKDGSILSTLSFQIIVDKAPVGKQVTSTNEFLVLLEATRKAEDAAAAATKAANDANAAKDDIVAATEENANLAKSWAVGQTGKREGEDTDNAKYYAEKSEKAVSEVRPAVVELKDQNGSGQTCPFALWHLSYEAIRITGTYDDDAGTITFHRSQDSTDEKVFLKDGYIWKEELWTPGPEHHGAIWVPPYPHSDVRNGVENLHRVLYPHKGCKMWMTDFWAGDDEPKECLWTGDSVDGKINWVNDLGHKMENCDDPYWLDALREDPDAEVWEG